MPGSSVRRQLTVLLGSTLIVSLACLALTFLQLADLRGAHRELEERLIPAQQRIAAVDQLVGTVDVHLRTDGDLDAEAIDQARQSFDGSIAAISGGIGADDELAPLLDEVRAEGDRWFAELTADGVAGSSLLNDRVNTFSATVIDRIDDAYGDAASASAWIRSMLLLTVVAVVGGKLLALFLLRRSVVAPLESLVHDINSVADGNLSDRIEASGPSDLASVGHAAERMRRRLLDDAERRTESAVIAGHLAESSRIAGQLHDDQVQAMTLVSIRLQQLAGRVGDDADLAEPIAAAREATHQATERLRRMMFELHSPVLETEGLAAAIDVYLDETFADEVRTRIVDELGTVTDATAALAYRLAREALMNVRKHAHATQVVVELRTAGNVLTLCITDDGVGFDPASVGTAPGHLGVRHAEQLASAAGGSWSVTSEPGAGTVVTIRLPIRESSHEQPGPLHG